MFERIEHESLRIKIFLFFEIMTTKKKETEDENLLSNETDSSKEISREELTRAFDPDIVPGVPLDAGNWDDPDKTNPPNGLKYQWGFVHDGNPLNSERATYLLLERSYRTASQFYYTQQIRLCTDGNIDKREVLGPIDPWPLVPPAEPRDVWIGIEWESVLGGGGGCDCPDASTTEKGLVQLASNTGDNTDEGLVPVLGSNGKLNANIIPPMRNKYYSQYLSNASANLPNDSDTYILYATGAPSGPNNPTSMVTFNLPAPSSILFDKIKVTLIIYDGSGGAQWNTTIKLMQGGTEIVSMSASNPSSSVRRYLVLQNFGEGAGGVSVQDAPYRITYDSGVI